MNDFKLQFLLNEADEEEGIGHPGIETYKDSPYASTARECGQNSSDARTSQPVTINFDILEIDSSDLGLSEQLLPAVQNCLEKALEKEEEKSLDFFIQAESILKQETLKVLAITDHNTTGLRGPCSPGHPFHSLVKSTGVSNKELDTSGGSFGIGKNAVYAISDLQTVFYSTIYTDDKGDKQFLAQGKSILISHIDSEDVSHRATGYWGALDYNPIDNTDLAPEWLRRETQGTSIYALGFRDTSNWDYRMVASLIRNFFTALHREEMEFNLCDGSITVNSKTLPGLYGDEKVKAAAEESNQLDEFNYSHCLYQCLTSEEAKLKVVEIEGMGKVHIHILVRDELPKRVSIIRNGMVITDSLEKFGDKFSVFPMCREFVAFVEPCEVEGSAMIKRLENPRHDGLSAERITNNNKREEAMRVMKTLARAIRDAIKEETLSKPDQVQSLDEMAKFFADADEKRGIPDPDSEQDPETYVYKPRDRIPKRPPAPPVSGSGSGGGSGAGNSGDGGDKSGDGGGSGGADGGSGARSRRLPVELSDCRNIIDLDGGNKRTIWFTPDRDGPITLSVYATGMNTSDEMKVESTSDGTVSAGRVEIDVTAGERQRVEFTLTEEYGGPIDLVALSYQTASVTNAN